MALTGSGRPCRQTASSAAPATMPFPTPDCGTVRSRFSSAARACGWRILPSAYATSATTVGLVAARAASAYGRRSGTAALSAIWPSAKAAAAATEVSACASAGPSSATPSLRRRFASTDAARDGGIAVGQRGAQVRLVVLAAVGQPQQPRLRDAPRGRGGRRRPRGGAGGEEERGGGQAHGVHRHAGCRAVRRKASITSAG